VRLTQQAAKAPQLPRRYLDQLAHLGQRGFQIKDMRPCDFQRVGRIVFRQNAVFAVQDQSAIGGNRHQRNAIAFGASGVVIVLRNLQIKSARQQRGRQQRNEGRTCFQSPMKASQFPIQIF